MTIKIGLKSVLFKPGQTENRLKQIMQLQDSGYISVKAVEPRIVADKDLGENFETTKKQVNTIAAAAHEHGISFDLEINDGWSENGNNFPMDVISPHEKIRETSLRYVERAEELARESKYCGSLLFPFLGNEQVIPYGRRPTTIDREKAIQDFRKFLEKHPSVNQLQTVAYSGNMHIAGHNLPFYYTPIFSVKHIMQTTKNLNSVNATMDVAHDALDWHFEYLMSQRTKNGKAPETIRTVFGDLYTSMFDRSSFEFGPLRVRPLSELITEGIVNSIKNNSSRINAYHMSNVVAFDSEGKPCPPEVGLPPVHAGMRWNHSYGMMNVPQIGRAIKEYTPNARIICEEDEMSGDYMGIPQNIDLAKHLVTSLA